MGQNLGFVTQELVGEVPMQGIFPDISLKFFVVLY